MEQTQLAVCILLATNSSDFWSIAVSIATVVTTVAVAAASIYRYFTATSLEKLYLKGMDAVWIRLGDGLKKIFEAFLFLFLCNFLIPVAVRFMLCFNTWKQGIHWLLDLSAKGGVIVLIVWLVVWSIIVTIVPMIPKGDILSMWLEKKVYNCPVIQGCITVVYFISSLSIFPWIVRLQNNFSFGVDEGFFELLYSYIISFQEKWRAVLLIFLMEWLFFISLGIPGFIINFKRRKAYMKILESKPNEGKELFVYFKEDNYLVCGESEDIAKVCEYKYIKIEEVYDGKYILKNNDGGLKDQKKLTVRKRLSLMLDGLKKKLRLGRSLFRNKGGKR